MEDKRVQEELEKLENADSALKEINESTVINLNFQRERQMIIDEKRDLEDELSDGLVEADIKDSIKEYEAFNDGGVEEVLENPDKLRELMDNYKTYSNNEDYLPDDEELKKMIKEYIREEKSE